MSFNKHYRQAWIVKVYAETVKLFHEARKADENKDVPLVDLARQCANTTFAEHADTIVGDRETTARDFMRHCRNNIATEISAAIAAQAQSDIDATQIQEARAS